jgi:glutathione S-transferase
LLYAHLFSSYSQKAFIAFYEKRQPFTLRQLSPENPAAEQEWRALWPIARFPVLRAGDATVVEASSIIEWLDLHSPEGPRMIPDDPQAALDVRMRDRIFDSYVMRPMQTVAFDRIRPEPSRDPYGVAQALEMLDRSYAWLDGEMASHEWACGDVFGLADCSAAPALFYADWVRPIDAYPNLLAYYERLRRRASFARCVDDAKSFRELFPGGAPPDRMN